MNDQAINFDEQANEEMVTISKHEYEVLLFKANKLETYMLIEQAQKSSATRKVATDKGPSGKEQFGQFLAENPELLLQAGGRKKALAYAEGVMGKSYNWASTYYSNFKSGLWALPAITQASQEASQLSRTQLSCLDIEEVE